MRLPVLAGLALLSQSALLVNIGGLARPEHMRYQRAVQLPSDRSGVACVALDAQVLAHTASAAHNDLRLFRTGANGSVSEVPYTLTESGPEPVADATATPENTAVHGNELAFDLRMPARLYSEVRLRLDLRDFVATATVEGRDGRGKRASLGSVPVFDLSAAHDGRWTSLLLAESNWPELHIVLAVRTPEGKPLLGLTPGMVQGAAVPPSRTRQTQFVPVVETRRVEQRGTMSAAVLRVPAHVPVERVAFTFQPGFEGNFSREVTVSARADGAPVMDTEATDAGAIAHVSLASGDPRLYPIALREDAVNATLGATLVRPATVLVAVHNEGLPPLPIRSVALEMRERKLCFPVEPGGSYTLRYGDAALPEPRYDEGAMAIPAQVVDAHLEPILGPEEKNPHFVQRHDTRPLLRRHPEIFWLLLLVCGGTMGGTALQYVQQRRA